MDLKAQIEQYIEKNKDPMNHEFANGSKLINQRLSRFLINWYNQSIIEYENEGTTKNADAIKKLISNH